LAWLNPRQGNTLAGFAEAFLRARALQQQSEAAEQMGELRAMQIGQARQGMLDEQRARSVIPGIIGAQPTPVEYAPAVPAVAPTPGVPARMTLADNYDPALLGDEAALGHPATGSPVIGGTPAIPGTPGTPGRPALTTSAHTIESLTQAAGGPEAMAAALRTPGGRQALELKKPITDESFRAKQAELRGKVDFERGMEDGFKLRSEGKELDAINRESAAIRAYAAVLPGPQTGLYNNLRDLTKEQLALLKDKKEQERADADGAKVAPAFRAWKENPSLATWADVFLAYEGTTSETYKKRAAIFAGNFEKMAGDAVQRKELSAQIAPLMVAATRVMGEQIEAGRPISMNEALKRAQVADPKAAGAAWTAVMLGGKGVHPEFAKALMGDKAAGVPKGVLQEADAIIAQTKNPATGAFWERSDQGWPAAVTAMTTKITLERQRPAASGTDREGQTTTKLISTRNQITRELNQAQKNMEALRPSSPEHAPLKQRIGKLQQQLTSLDEALSGRGIPIGSADIEIPTPPPSPAKPSAALALPPDRKQAIKTATVQVLKKKYPDRAAAIDADSRAFWLSLSDADRAALSPEVDRLIQGAR